MPHKDKTSPIYLQMRSRSQRKSRFLRRYPNATPDQLVAHMATTGQTRPAKRTRAAAPKPAKAKPAPSADQVRTQTRRYIESQTRLSPNRYAGSVLADVSGKVPCTVTPPGQYAVPYTSWVKPERIEAARLAHQEKGNRFFAPPISRAGA